MDELEVKRVEIRVLKFFLTFKAVPTKNGKKKPQLVNWCCEGLDPSISFFDIPKELLNLAYKKAAVIFNKF